jgi:transketolase C-terminal domain/subunit
VVTAEDNTVKGGLGAAVMEDLMAAGVVLPVRQVGLPDEFLPAGTQAELLEEFGLTAEGVAAAALGALETAEVDAPRTRAVG